MTVILEPNRFYKNRKLEILVCPVCGGLSAVLIQQNIKTGEYDVYRPKRKNTSKFIQKLENEKWKIVHEKIPTKQNAGFVYGVNRQRSNGKIFQYSVDFNGTRRLVKVIERCPNKFLR